jgi:hypothetical protein
MPIRVYLGHESGLFGPDDITIMNAAFDAALNRLGITDRKSPSAAIVADRIIEGAKAGVRDPYELCERALKGLIP